MDSKNTFRPLRRSYLRRVLGREYFIFRQRLRWAGMSRTFARPDVNTDLEHSVFRHRSILLRPLRNVEMYLQHNKITNLALAIDKIDKVVLRPGETFSVWRLVGRPTAAKGYLNGLVLWNGRIEKGIGGGLCQLGNLLYWIALHSPLTVAERHRHTFDVFPDVNRKVPFACGATLAYNYIDLQLKNDTDSTFQIRVWLDDEHLNGELLSDRPVTESYEIYETDHMIRLQPWGGYTRHNRIWRRTTDLIDHSNHEELIAENHAVMMYDPLLTA